MPGTRPGMTALVKLSPFFFAAQENLAKMVA
jgi:hypothetical protein